MIEAAVIGFKLFCPCIPAHHTLSFSYVILLYSFPIKVIFYLYYKFWYYQIFPSLIHVLSHSPSLNIYTYIWISSLPLKERSDVLLVTTFKQPKQKERVAFLYFQSNLTHTFSLCTCYSSTTSSSSYWGKMEKYEVVKDLGAGNFGVARLLRHKDTKELVAMKYIERGHKVCFFNVYYLSHLFLHFFGYY